jgi:hypothetical protein
MLIKLYGDRRFSSTKGCPGGHRCFASGIYGQFGTNLLGASTVRTADKILAYFKLEAEIVVLNN